MCTGLAIIIVGSALAGTDLNSVLVLGVVLAGAFLGVNNTLITETVMRAAPVERPVHIDAEPAHGAESPHSRREAEVVAVANA